MVQYYYTSDPADTIRRGFANVFRPFDNADKIRRQREIDQQRAEKFARWQSDVAYQDRMRARDELQSDAKFAE